MNVVLQQSIDLLSPFRLDVLLRYRYAHALINQYSPNWGLFVYRQFLEHEAAIGGYGDNNKNDFNDYLVAYTNLISSLSKEGFKEDVSCIPISNGVPCNGGHRLAASIVLGLKVPTENTSLPSYAFTFQNLKRLELSNFIVDDLLLNYCEIKPQSRYIALLGQKQKNHEDFSNYCTETVGFIGLKQIKLTQIGKRRLLKLMYSQNDWWKASLVEEFVRLRFDEYASSNLATISFFDEQYMSANITSLKSNLRSNLLDDDQYKRNIHSSDTHSETLSMAQSIFNSNSLHFMQNAPINSELTFVDKLNNLNWKDTALSDICVTGSGVLDIYGLRDSSDIDILYGGSKLSKPRIHNLVSKDPVHYDLIPDGDQIVYDPRYHLYVDGFKFISLKSILLYKLTRNENKDISDSKIIHEYLTSSHSEIYYAITLSENLKLKLSVLLQKIGIHKLILRTYYKLVIILKGLRQSDGGA